MDIVYSFEIDAAPLEVYHAVATQQGITGWWSKDCKVAEEIGGQSDLRFNKEGKIVEMHFRTDQLQPGRSVAWTCVENPNPAWIGTELRYEIAESDKGTRLSFSHVRWDSKWEGQEPYEMTKEGWEHFMKSLKTFCETGAGQPW